MLLTNTKQNPPTVLRATELTDEGILVIGKILCSECSKKKRVKTQSRAGNDTNEISALSWISDRVSSKSCVFYRLPFPRRLREVLGASTQR